MYDIIDPTKLAGYLRLDEIHPDDTAAMQMAAEAAEAFVVNYVGRAPSELIEMGDGQYPADFTMAAYLVACDFFENRDAHRDGRQTVTPGNVAFLLNPYVAL